MAELNYKNGFPDLETKVEGTSAKQGDNNGSFDDKDVVFVSLEEAVALEKEANSAKSTPNAKTYGQIALRFAEAAIVKVALPAAALCADVPVIGGTLVGATGVACVVNLTGLGVKIGAEQIVPNNAKQIQESVNSGLDCFNKDLFKITSKLCSLEHEVLYGIQGLVGQGVSTLANNIEDPSAIMAAGKTAMNFAFSAWDSVKCAYDYISAFRASETAQCSGEAESLDEQSV
jgi:hypothetical protein